MFTFQKTAKEPLFHIDDKPIFTTYKKDQNSRIKPFRKSNDYLGSEEFRERYDLTRNEAKQLKRAIQSDIVPESKLKTKFYTVRKDLNKRLYTEIDLRGTNHTITWRYPTDVKAWPYSQIFIGGSNSGKTFLVTSQIEEALKRKKKRKFLYISPELESDTTLKKLLNSKRHQKYFQGISVSDEALEESEKDLETFWKQDVEKHLLAQPPGTCCAR